MRIDQFGNVCYAGGPGTGYNRTIIDARHGTDAGWLLASIIVEQLQTIAGDDNSWKVVKRFAVGDPDVEVVWPEGATRVRGGGNVWAGWRPGRGQASWGRLPDECALLDVSPDGLTAITPNYQQSQNIEVYNPTGQIIMAYQTGPLINDAAAGPNTRIRDGVLTYQDPSGWHAFRVLTGAPIETLPRTGVHFLVPFVYQDAVWFMERTGGEDTGNAQLSLRPANSPSGIIVATTNAFEPDARKMSDARISVWWSVLAGVTPDRLRDATVDLTTAPRVPLFDGPEPPDPPQPPTTNIEHAIVLLEQIKIDAGRAITLLKETK